jgi:hypothetical protein
MNRSATCTKCRDQPGFHIFSIMGTNSAGNTIYYTAPRHNIEPKFTEETMTNYLIHMDTTIGSDWVWIFDAAGLEKVDMPNPVLMRKFYKTIVERYGKSLKYIYMLNMNWKIEAIYKIIKTFSSEDTKKRVVICKEPIELVAAGIPVTVIEKVYQITI